VPSSTRSSLLPYLAAAAGGVLGALTRWGIAEALPHPTGSWPWATLLVNVTGCLTLGLLITALFARYPDRPWLRPFLGTGVLGGYTTFSTFAVDIVALADAGAVVTAVGYVAASVVGGVLAAVTGVVLGRSVLRRPVPRSVAIAAEEDIA
jgi:CrcB protein